MLRPLHRPAQYLPWTNFCNRFLMVCCQNTTTQSEINFVDFTLMDFVWSSRVWFFQKRGGIGGKLWENPCRCMLQLCYVISTCFFWVKISMFQCMERNPIRGLRVRWKLRSPKSNAFQTMSQWWVVERVFESICRDILGVRSLRVCFFSNKMPYKTQIHDLEIVCFRAIKHMKMKNKKSRSLLRGYQSIPEIGIFYCGNGLSTGCKSSSDFATWWTKIVRACYCPSGWQSGNDWLQKRRAGLGVGRATQCPPRQSLATLLMWTWIVLQNQGFQKKISKKQIKQHRKHTASQNVRKNVVAELLLGTGICVCVSSAELPAVCETLKLTFTEQTPRFHPCFPTVTHFDYELSGQLETEWETGSLQDSGP